RDQQPALAKAVAAREALAVGDGVQLVLLHVDQAEIFHTAPEGAAEAGPYRDLLRRQLRETPLDEPPFGLLTSERQRALEGGARLRRPSEPAAQFRARRVRQPVVAQLAARENAVDDCQARLRTVTHRHGD